MRQMRAEMSLRVRPSMVLGGFLESFKSAHAGRLSNNPLFHIELRTNLAMDVALENDVSV